MPIPPAFEVRLAAYGITAEVQAARRDVWTIVEPTFPAVVDDYLETSLKFAPAIADHVVRPRDAALQIPIHQRDWPRPAEA
jgi:hypothetical protein